MKPKSGGYFFAVGTHHTSPPSRPGSFNNVARGLQYIYGHCGDLLLELDPTRHDLTCIKIKLLR